MSDPRRSPPWSPPPFEARTVENRDAIGQALDSVIVELAVVPMRKDLVMSAKRAPPVCDQHVVDRGIHYQPFFVAAHNWVARLLICPGVVLTKIAREVAWDRLEKPGGLAMVKFVARQSIDSEKLTAPGTEIKVVFKKSSTSVIATRDTKYYTIDGMNTPNKSKTLDLLKNADKLFKGSDTLIGSEFGDTLKGFDKSDKIKGQAGDDTIVGGNGPDTLFGQGGDDNISGGRGDDWLYGGSGSNILSGGAGNNNFVFDAALNGKNISTISDFKIFGDENGVDLIGLDKKIFKDLMAKGGGDVLFPRKLFRVGEDTSKLEDHSLIYDKSTGVISYTSNGSIADSIAFCKIQSDVDYLSAINFIFV